MAILFPEKLRQEEGKKARELLQQFGTIHSSKRLDAVGERLIQYCKLPVTVHFFVVDSKEVNAVATPNGDIYVWRGLLGIVGDSEDELAAVLAHELGHLVHDHFLRSIYLLSVLQAVFWFFARPLGFWGRQISARIIGSGYSKFRERQADDLAFQLLKDAGYSPKAMIALFYKIDRMVKVPSFFSSHPAPKSRATRIEKQMTQKVVLDITEKRSVSQSNLQEIEERDNLIPFPAQKKEKNPTED